MGISQLLPLLEKSTRPCHVSELRGRTVAVDSYCWLHKGARSCALQLAKGEETDMYVTYCLKYVNMLLSYDIKPIMVFDGRHLPAKLKTEEKRRISKKHARKQGMEFLRLGQTAEAYKFFCQCVEVTPAMALALIKECRKLHVDCIVAPYESDAQLAYFSLKGIADCIISEDSDLLLFGCKKVLYKMDVNGCGQLVEAEKLHLSMKMRPEKYSFDKFRHMCILSGCDYLDSLPGIGLKKALKFVTMTAETNPALFLDKVPRYLNMRHLAINEEYKENFFIADSTFLHQTVFDPFQKRLIPLTPIQTNPEYCKNSGDQFDHNEAFQLAIGNLNPLTMEKIDNWDPNNSIISQYSIWSTNFKPRPLISEKKPQQESKLIKTKSFDSTAVEVAKLEHDQLVEKELEFYKNMTPVTVDVQTDPVSPPRPEPSVSPVLGNNPFIKKKISKFQVTETTLSKKVVSRFFSSTASENQTESSAETSECSSPLSTPPNDDEIAQAEFDAELFPILTPEENRAEMEILSWQSQEDENVLESDDDYPLVECECILEVDETECEIVTENTLVSVENLPKDLNKKRKFVSEPAISLSKRPKNQPTIQDMFKRMKMKS
ncbi:exonuclease 1 [Tenebrio molitor]|uniref:exonuclease 1 n=1 Tax=Tenebrio molitor TaxID=7067 RepID=UPI003624A78E